MKEVQTPCFQNTWNNSSNISPNEVYYSKADFPFPQILFLLSFTVPSLVPQLSDLKYGPMVVFFSFFSPFILVLFFIVDADKIVSFCPSWNTCSLQSTAPAGSLF